MSTRVQKFCLAIGGLMLSSGCAMCCGLYDNDYLATSELLQRTDPSHGRVGSVFSDPQAGISGEWSEGIALTTPETLPTPRETLPAGGAPESSVPELTTPQQPTPASSGGTSGPTLVPTQGVSVREDLQSRRPTRMSSQTLGNIPRKLSSTPSMPLQSPPRFERQPIRQVSERR